MIYVTHESVPGAVNGNKGWSTSFSTAVLSGDLSLFVILCQLLQIEKKHRATTENTFKGLLRKD